MIADQALKRLQIIAEFANILSVTLRLLDRLIDKRARTAPVLQEFAGFLLGFVKAAWRIFRVLGHCLRHDKHSHLET